MTHRTVTASYDVAVVGAGIVGLAHAWRAATRGQRVLLVERSAVANGASIRNFGVVWPIGQPIGRTFELAIESRRLWLELAEKAGIWAQPCGSIHVAHHDDEVSVLTEYRDFAASNGIDLGLLTPDEVTRRTPAANPVGLRGGLWSPNELCVNPRDAIRQIGEYLSSLPNVDVHFETTIVSVENNELRASDGRRWSTDQTIVCSGIDFDTLFPTAFRDAGLQTTKLQMLRTVRQPAGWDIGTHLASGLSLRHYTAFEVCPSLEALRSRVAHESPELDALGIHVMASQHDAGHVVLGDSHEYGDDISPFDRGEIETILLRELKQRFQLPNWTIESRWHGCYAKQPNDPLVRLEPRDNVTICISPGGAGMTVSFGWAEEFWKGKIDGVRV